MRDYSPAALAAKDAVRERDGNRCVDCGIEADPGRKLDVHRLDPGSEYSLGGCVTVCRGCHKGRHRNIPSIDADIVHKAKSIAASKGITISEYLSAILEPLVNHDFDAFRKEINDKPKK